MFKGGFLGRKSPLRLAGTAAALFAAGLHVAAAAQGGGPAVQVAPVTLGVSYVAPPHVPGAKVRTPEGPVPALVDRLGRRFPLQPVVTSGQEAVSAAGTGKADFHLLSLNAEEAGKAPGVVIPTGYRAGIMAIMRTDTDIQQWDDLRDRTVCLAEGSGLTGQLAARYGAREKVFRAPADALLDLRIGGCDATVHDSTLLGALLQLPEWQKFSASLPVQRERDLVFIVPKASSGLAGQLREAVQAWKQEGLLAKLTQQAARDIAFEVYMDQEVPDCH